MNTKHYKKIAEEMGDAYANGLKEMKFFRFDPSLNNFVKTRELEGDTPAEFRMNRAVMSNEQKLVQSVLPYIAFITAPSDIEADDVIGRGWEQTRILIDNIKKFKGMETDNYGFSNDVSDDDAINNYLMFSEGFKITAGKIEKVMPAIEVVKEDVLVTDMINSLDATV